MKLIILIAVIMMIVYAEINHTTTQTKLNLLINNQKNIKIETIKKKKAENTLRLTITAYSPTREECDDDPNITASMEKVKEGGVAVSRDLFKKGWVFGKKVYIEGHGIYRINDLMNKRYKNRVDIFIWNTNKALEFGVKKNVLVALLRI